MEEKILEEFETADPETHTIDPETGNHIYWGERVVGHRVHEVEGLQYIVRYKNKQLQWWNEVDVKNCFPNHLRTYKRSKKGKRKVGTYGRNQSFASPSAEPSPSPAKDEKRVTKRKLSSSLNEEEAEPANEAGEKSVPGSPSNSSPIVIASTRSMGQFKKLKSTPPSTATTDTCAVLIEGNSNIRKSDKSSEPEKPEDDPLDLKSVAMKHAQAITDSITLSLRAARESDTIEIEKLKNSNANLEELLAKKQNEIDDMRKEHEEIMAVKDVQCEELATENEKIKMDSLKALRDIVGSGRYEESDDTATLRKKAIVLIQQLDCFLSATKNAQRLLEFEPQNIKPETKIVYEQIE